MSKDCMLLIVQNFLKGQARIIKDGNWEMSEKVEQLEVISNINKMVNNYDDILVYMNKNKELER